MEKNTKNNSQTTETRTCGYDCEYFCSLNPSDAEGAPPAWCNPPGSKAAQPCLVGEDASNKSCYRQRVIKFDQD